MATACPLGSRRILTLPMPAEGPIKDYLEASPHIRSLELTNQDGKPFTAKDLFGKFAVITFGTTQSSDVNSVATVAK